MSVDAVHGADRGVLTVTAGCCDGCMRGFVCGEEGEGHVGGAQVPQWSLKGQGRYKTR